MSSAAPETSTPQITSTGRWIVLAVAFLGWGFAGVHMSMNGIVMRVATADLMATDFAAQGIAAASNATVDPQTVAEFDADENGALNDAEKAKAREAVLGQWFGWFTCAFLLGAAAGGYIFGFVGDRYGRAKAMASSILCYSVFSAVSYFVESPTQLLVLRFLTCLGIGGMWPNGIALLSEAWSGVSKPVVSGVMGTAANVGILLFALFTILGKKVTLEPEPDWRWTFAVGASPLILGILAWLGVPESPRWLALQQQPDTSDDAPAQVGLGEIFQSPIRKLTIIGILLGTIPLFGGWGVSNWATAWASEVGDQQTAQKADTPDAEVEEEKPVEKKRSSGAILKSMTVVARSLPGAITSLIGATVAFWLGRKRTYFVLCIGALVCTQFLFRVESPKTSTLLFTINMFGESLEITAFLAWTAGLGFFSGFFFGWLPLCLPELFPTRVRSTGAGVSFNWGRILTAVGVLVSAALLKDYFRGQYADVGRVTGFIYVFGLVIILFAPLKDDKTGDEDGESAS